VGSHCETSSILCPGGVLSCLNGGTCFKSAGGTDLCSCPAAYAGSKCQLLIGVTVNSTVYTPGPKQIPTWIAAPIIIGCVLLFAAIGGIVYMVRRERAGKPLFARLLPDSRVMPGQELAAKEVSV